jgi:phosphate acetyltransferase
MPEDILKKIYQKARSRLMTVVLPESKDQRILQAADFVEKEGLAKVILLDREKLEKEKIEKFAEEFYRLRRHKGITLQDARETVSRPLYYAAMMVRNNQADGFVAGASNTTPDVARAAIYCLGVDRSVGIVSSCFLMILPDASMGESGVFLFADCGIVPQPTARELSSIALSTAKTAADIMNISPRVAMLSYSTKGSSGGRLVERVREAVKLIRQKDPNLIVDGEVQSDTAISPEVASIKDPEGILKGRANVLIFPNLESGNIAYKLVEKLAKAKAVGPILQGLNHPCSDLSRGCDVEEIIGCVAITAIRAQNRTKE